MPARLICPPDGVNGHKRGIGKKGKIETAEKLLKKKQLNI